MCVKKRRYLDKGSVASRMGLELFRRFFEINTAQKSTKTIEDFIDSKYYTTFIKFARRLMDLRPVDQSRFIDYVFTNGIKERDWCKDKVYEAYIVDLLAKEPASRGLERSIEAMGEWSVKHDVPLNEFFFHVSPSEATYMVQLGKISPWVLYLSESADALWSRLSDEQADIIGSIIDPRIWKAKFELKKDDCSFVRTILKESHI